MSLSCNEDQRWQGVICRKENTADRFVYAVRTTGIYCRPDCPSRLPNRENVRFFDRPQEAERAGFRPCRRCQPDLPVHEVSPTTNQHRKAILRACELLEKPEKPPPLAELSQQVEMSPSHFHRVFKEILGVTPRAYADKIRWSRATTALTKGEPVTELALRSGFPSPGRFYANAPDHLGMTPTTYRQKGKGALIRFALGECSLGSILVGATERGICSIALGDDPQKLLVDFQHQFAQGTLVGGDAKYDAWVAQVVGLVESPWSELDLPLDIQGTAFQIRVWELIRQIPAGETVTYSELAKRMELPKSVRAIASACAANQIAVAIPCHRVIRTDGALAGYRWGIERKAALLTREQNSSQ